MASRDTLSKVIDKYSDREMAEALREVMAIEGHDVFTDDALRAIALRLGVNCRFHERMRAESRAFHAARRCSPIPVPQAAE